MDVGFSEAISNLSLKIDLKEDENISNLYYFCEGDEEYLIKCHSHEESANSSCRKVAGVVCKDEGNYWKYIYQVYY